MNIFQKVWAMIISIFEIPWIRDFISFLVDKTKEILKQIGEENYLKIKVKVQEVAEEDISGVKKFEKVYDYIKSLLPNLPDSTISYLIESLVQEIKKNK